MRFDMRPGQGKHGSKRAMMTMMANGFGPGDGFAGGFGGHRGGGSGGGWDGDGPHGPHGFGRGRRGPGGRGGRMFGTGELRLLLLSLLAEQERHGYELIKAIEELTGGQYAPSPGVVYPTLALLVDEGLIAEVPGNGARKAFAATDAGRAETVARADEAAAITARLKGVGEAGGRQASPPVMRAMANLRMALRGRISAPGFETETAHAIAEILDEAARKVERL